MDLDARLNIEQEKLNAMVGVIGIDLEKIMKQSKVVDVLIAAKMKKELGAAGSKKIM